MINHTNKSVRFNTGNEEIDNRLGPERISSNEVVEISGASGSGKTFLCLKMASLALIEQSVGVIYVDTTNYINNENLNIVLKNFIADPDKEKKEEKMQELLGRLKVLKIHELDKLIILLAKIISQLKNKQQNFNLKMIIIDSLSSLF